MRGLWCHSTSCITQTLSDYRLLTLDPVTVCRCVDAFSLVTQSISPFLLLLQSCGQVAFIYDANSQVCCALFAFQMAHKLLLSSFGGSTRVLPWVIISTANVAISALFPPDSLHDIQSVHYKSFLVWIRLNQTFEWGYFPNIPFRCYSYRRSTVWNHLSFDI